MTTDEHDIELDGVIVKETEWFRPIHQKRYVKYFLWRHLATSSVTGQSIPQAFYAKAVSPCEPEKRDDNSAKLSMCNFIAEAKNGKGYIHGFDRVGMIVAAIFEVLDEWAGDDVITLEEKRKAISCAVSGANNAYEEKIAELTRLGGNPSDWSIPIVPLTIKEHTQGKK